MPRQLISWPIRPLEMIQARVFGGNFASAVESVPKCDKGVGFNADGTASRSCTVKSRPCSMAHPQKELRVCNRSSLLAAARQGLQDARDRGHTDAQMPS
jgi:hypothetical protein